MHMEHCLYADYLSEIPLLAVGFMKAVAALIIVSWMVTFVAGCLIVAGMMSSSDYLKFVVYRVAIVLTVIAGMYNTYVHIAYVCCICA